MKNRKIIYWILILFLLAATITGTVFAYMFRRTEYKNNQFIPANVSCMVHEITDNDDVTYITQKTSITVKNTGNIPAYIRVRLVSYWVKVIGEGEVEITGRESEMPEISPETGWMPEANNTYYYCTPVAPGDFTQELLGEPIALVKDGDYLQVVEVFAEAIQSAPSDAVTSAWKVSVASDGMINPMN